MIIIEINNMTNLKINIEKKINITINKKNKKNNNKILAQFIN